MAGAPAGSEGGAPAGIWGGIPSNVLAAKPPRDLGRSPNRRGPPAPPPLWLRHCQIIPYYLEYDGISPPQMVYFSEGDKKKGGGSYSRDGSYYFVPFILPQSLRFLVF